MPEEKRHRKMDGKMILEIESCVYTAFRFKNMEHQSWTGNRTSILGLDDFSQCLAFWRYVCLRSLNAFINVWQTLISIYRSASLWRSIIIRCWYNRHTMRLQMKLDFVPSPLHVHYSLPRSTHTMAHHGLLSELSEYWQRATGGCHQ